jgi:DNA-binding SARP family transcriptional activator/tetratricopeptide (TPR) repeat protein
MEFWLLGPIRVTVNGEPLALGGRLQRLLLALLLLDAGKPLPVDRLIDLLWAEQPPHQARNALFVHISRLRQRLADAGAVRFGVALVSDAAGYAIEVPSGTVDVQRFTAGVAQARGVSDPAARSEKLQQALSLWRGDALADVAAGPQRQRLCAHLEELRLAAVELRVDADLESGCLDSLIPQLAGLVAGHPEREGLVASQMLALYRAGRQEDALQAYSRAAERLCDELGLDPGIRLRELRGAILRCDPALSLPPSAARSAPAATPVPRTLPADIPDFTGRAAAVNWLDESAQNPRGRTLITAIAGPGGVGKTALAVHWAHRVAAKFPDGQLYIDLRGYHPLGPVPAIEALTALLRALDVSDDRVPDDLDQAAALYRSVLADRQVLVLLDNARHAEHVRPLLPAGARTMVLITSRDSLTGLIARDGARRMTLDALRPAEAARLLTTIIGTARCEADPPATADLAGLCGYLPLALRIAAANLTDQPELPVASYAALLRGGQRIALLAVGDDARSALEPVFRESCAILSSPEHQMFRVLGLIPGLDFTASAAAALAGVPDRDAPPLLSRLRDSHLVAERAESRFALHDLTREYAAGLAAACDTPEARQAALRRLMSWYLGHCEAAHAAMYPTTLALAPAGMAFAFGSAADAMRWLNTEHANIAAAIEHAAVHGPHELAWQLLSSVRPFLLRLRATAELLRLARITLPAAEAAADLRAQCSIHVGVADGYLQSGQLEPALDSARHCRDLARQADWPEAEVASLNLLGVTCSFLGDLSEAAAHLAGAIAILDSRHVAYRRSTTLHRQGVIYGLLGDLPAAAAHMEQALACTHEENGGDFAVAICLSTLAIVNRLRSEHDLARTQIEQAMALNLSVDAQHGAAIDRMQLAKILRDLGDLTNALHHVSESRAVLEASPDETSLTHSRLTHGTICAELGNLDQASSHVRDALDLAARANNRHNVAECLITLALIRIGQDRHSDALMCATQALELADRGNFMLLRGQASEILAELHRRAGHQTAAANHAHIAELSYTAAGHRMAPCPVSWLPSVSWP